MKNLDEKIKRVLDITREIEERKKLYEELDRLVLELRETGFRGTELEGFYLELVDNFSGTNCAFRPAAVRRFEVKVETTEKRNKRLSRAKRAK